MCVSCGCILPTIIRQIRKEFRLKFDIYIFKLNIEDSIDRILKRLFIIYIVTLI